MYATESTLQTNQIMFNSTFDDYLITNNYNLKLKPVTMMTVLQAFLKTALVIWTAPYSKLYLFSLCAMVRVIQELY